MLQVNACLQHRILGFGNKPLWDSFLCFSISMASVTTKMLLQKARETKVTWCQDPTQPNRWQSCCSNSDRSVMNIHHTVLTWQEVTINFSVLWRSTLVATDSKILWKSKKLSLSGSAANLKILCWRHTFTDNTLSQMPKPADWPHRKNLSHVKYFAQKVAR